MRVAFYQVSSAMVPTCVEMGYRVFKLGEEAMIPLESFDLSSPDYKKFRKVINRMEREGWSFEIWQAAEVARRMGELKAVSDSWLSHHGAKEKGFSLGRFDESYLSRLPAAVIVIGGKVVAFERLREMVVEVGHAPRKQPRIAVFSGVKMASSLQVSHRIQALIGDPGRWDVLPPDLRDWLETQRRLSVLPRPGVLACETFPRGDRWHFTLYGFAGRNAHQTLGLLLTRQMEALGLGPLGFVPSDHALMIWSVDPLTDPARLLNADTLRAGLDGWLSGNSLIKRTFRNVATIAGLMQRNLPGQRRSGKQATFSSDIIHDTLRRHDPDHLLLRITRDEARRGLVDFDRIEDMLRSNPLIDHALAPHVTPLSAPLVLEIGRVSVEGEGRERLMAREAERLMQEAGLA